MATAQEIIDLFKETGTDIEFGKTGDESSIQRAQRIAGEINRGDRDMANLRQSLSWVRDQGGTYVKSAAQIAQEQAAKDKLLSDEEKRRELNLVYAWLPPGALDAYIKEFIESGSSEAAWAQIRKSPQYEEWFPGNITEDGRVRLSEDEYAKVTASYDEVFINVGLNPAAFKGRYGELIRGDVSPYELETARINPMHDRIVSQSAQLKEWYSANFGVDLTDAALIASAIDPDLGEKILTKQISMAEIGGEASESGFDLTSDFAQRIIEESQLDRAGAESMFQKAENFVPVINVLAQRHADADDDFDLNEFIAADLFKDPTQMRRMNRLIAQERSSFSGGQLGSGAAMSRTTGGLTGLTER